jgi:hypothetical protein
VAGVVYVTAVPRAVAAICGSVLLVLGVSIMLSTMTGVSFIVMLMIVHCVSVLLFHNNLPRCLITLVSQSLL